MKGSTEPRNKFELKAVGKELWLHAMIWAVVLGIMGGLVLLDHAVDGVSFSRAGVEPRGLASLPAIIYTHFLHLSPLHFFTNLFPLVLLGELVLLRDTRDFFAVGIATMLVSGTAIWFFGGDVTRVGSGTLICGFLGATLVLGFIERKFLSIVISVGVGLLFMTTIVSAINPWTTGSWVGCASALMTGGLVGRSMLHKFPSHLTRSITDERT